MNQLYASIAILIYNLMEPISWNWTLISDQLTFACYSVPPPPSFSLSLSLSLSLSISVYECVCVCVCVSLKACVGVCVCVHVCKHASVYIWSESDRTWLQSLRCCRDERSSAEALWSAAVISSLVICSGFRPELCLYSAVQSSFVCVCVWILDRKGGRGEFCLISVFFSF